METFGAGFIYVFLRFLHVLVAPSYGVCGLRSARGTSHGSEEDSVPVTAVAGAGRRDQVACALVLPGLRGCAVKSRFVFQRRRALRSQLTFMWFANCLHVEEGEHAISFHCNVKSHNYGFSSPAGGRGLGERRARGCPSGWRGTLAQSSVLYSKQFFCWLWCFDLMKDS